MIFSFNFISSNLIIFFSISYLFLSIKFFFSSFIYLIILNYSKIIFFCSHQLICIIHFIILVNIFIFNIFIISCINIHILNIFFFIITIFLWAIPPIGWGDPFISSLYNFYIIIILYKSSFISVIWRHIKFILITIINIIQNISFMSTISL